jgi:hypothetical protein
MFIIKIRVPTSKTMEYIIMNDIPVVLEVHVINLTTNKTRLKWTFLSFFPQILQNKVKIKYILNRKIHSRLCVYTFAENEGRKKKIPLKYLNKKQ